MGFSVAAKPTPSGPACNLVGQVLAAPRRGVFAPDAEGPLLMRRSFAAVVTLDAILTNAM